MRLKFRFIFLNVFLLSCNDSGSDTNEKARDTKSDHFPFVIDTTKYKNYVSPKTTSRQTWLEFASYYFSYIGPRRDTIYKIYWPDYNFPGYYRSWKGYERYASGLESKIEIRTDSIGSGVSSYYILLTNRSKDTVAIAYGKEIPMILEAKDSRGLWKPIEELWTGGCGVGAGAIILPPGEIVLTSREVTNGDFSTELRYSYGSNYSQTFTGKISLRQFESRFDSNGILKESYTREMETRK